MSLPRIPLLPLLILPLAIVLLQWHAVAFWQAQVGRWPGVGWSVLLELISLWLWSRPGRRWFRPMAWVTTFLLLVGPLYQVSDPLVQELAALHGRNGAAPAQVALLQGRIAEAETSLDHYQKLSLAGRFGWQPKIDQAEARLAALRGGLTVALAAEARRREAARLNWRRAALIAGQLVSLALFQAAAVLALRALAGDLGKAGRSAEASAPEDDLTEPLVLELQQAVQRLARSGLSYTRIAEETGVGRAQLSLLMNHFDRAKRGERVLGVAALRAIRGKAHARFTL